MTHPAYTEPRSPGFQASPEAWSAYLAEWLNVCFFARGSLDAKTRTLTYGGLDHAQIFCWRVHHAVLRGWLKREWISPEAFEGVSFIHITWEGRQAAAKCNALPDAGRAAMTHRGYVAGVGELYGSDLEVRDVE